YCSDHFSRANRISVETLAYDLPLLRRTVRPFLPPDKDAEILDLGCGYGGLVHCISQLGFTHVTGVDLSAEMVTLAHTLGIAGVRQRDFIQVLEENPSTFALITALDGIEHQSRHDVLRVLDLIYE